MERTVSFSPYTLTVLWEDPAAPALYTVSEAGDARGLFASLPAPRPTLVCIEGVDWDRDLSPWAAKKVFRGGEDFSGGADAFLQALLTELIPAAETGLSPAWRAVFGYSLAGLFSLWAMTQTDVFARCASVSGSLWFDGFVDYLSGHPLLGAPERVYLSLGDREEQAKNPRMQQVRAATEATKAVIEAQGVPCAFELNPGGHFQDVPARQRRAVLALL